MYPAVKAKVSDLIPYARNSRTHGDEQVNQIVASITEWGFTNPVIIDDKNNIIAGHGRVMAANKLKLKEVPAVVVTGWTEAQKKAYVIADNKLALNAGWDMEMLKVELDELQGLDFNLDLTGFNHDEIYDMSLDVNFEPATIDDQGKLDELSPKMVNCPHCSKDFDSRGREIG